MLSADSCQYSINEQFPVENLVILPENQHEVAEIEQSALLSGKQRRVCLKRERRKRKRQALAKLRECARMCHYALPYADDQSIVEQDQDNVDEKADEEQREQERLHQEWLERERIAQEEFRLRKEKEEAAQKKKDDEERRIREEWEEQQKKERELQEQKKQEKRDRELENGASWKNPDAPVDYGTEKDKANCPFFIKTGACRFGDRCSRKHEHPTTSTTLMVRGMFVTFAMEQSRRDDYDTDASLEYSEDEMRQQFMDFYDDVLPEFRNAGKVVQFKVSCNFEPHLRGNVYVQYDTEDQCKKAFMMFNGRWYAGRQLQCEFSPVTKWKTAICGLFDRRKCPKGKHCNFLHVFQNPSHEFWEADRDLCLYSERGGFSGRHRAWSQRGHSPEQSRHRQEYSREKYRHRWRRSRSRSRERRSRSKSRERRSRSKSRERRSRSKSRERRSRSRSRERRSRSKSRERRSRSRDSRRSRHSPRKEKRSLNDRGRRSRSHDRHRSHSRNKETSFHSEGHHLHAESKTRSCRSDANLAEEQTKNSPRKPERGDGKSPKPNGASSTDANTSSRHHKRSKKSKRKKKNKKKQKRKRSKSCSVSSSAAGSEDDEDEETPKNEEKQGTELAKDDAELDKSISPKDNKEMKSCTPEFSQSVLAGIVTETGCD
ncbi:U2 small nuclear ribonucleoprotein auxiliary factor 35 kDa subunit-related protein 2 [Bagarius yarrelli]|uniref:U2 small nuclear ribonucleoprotein auxiliary factor 35 kDa subunit-related protein 2 n=1 Tax=Bagarius yarrelli TaxID=175774 RepID=A0A556U5T7_BAGYA|nr:U2 small nuclear ribonucleoprotein auxiliary factor 35 kDa subunit-related protein 2 [Bagarius yarrelli]